jgi:uracil-DNA glycosylase
LPDLAAELAAVRACRLCADRLPLGPRPVLRVSATARLLIVSQAPGTKVHASGLPFTDPSGVRLRAWMGVDDATFYDESRIALMPMGLCYPGVLPNGGDRPPMPICAPTWQPRILPLLAEVKLTLAVGSYAQARLIGRGSMTDIVRAFRAHLARGILPLPHPSWRTTGWERRNPWFGEELLPELRARVAALL